MALDRHITLFGRAPALAVADGGFASRTNEHVAHDRGVRHVVLARPARETLEAFIREHEYCGEQDTGLEDDRVWMTCSPPNWTS